MGVVKLAFQLILYTVIFSAVILLIPGLPPDIDFQAYTMDVPRKMEGKLAPNNILDKAELVLDGVITAPESIALRGEEVYTGVSGSGGRIVKIVNGKLSTVAKLGQECEGYWEESKCGRPLGVRFDNKGKLLVADAYYGIYKVDVDTGVAENIIPMNAKIEGGGKPIKFPDDLDVDKDGIIYWSDASAIATFDNQALEIMGSPSGRLFKYDPKTKKNVVLIDKLHFANGVQLSRNEDFVAIAETIMSRVWKYHLKGPKKGQKEILVDRLPGMPDNVRSNGKGGFYISLVVPRDETTPTILDQITQVPLARKLVLRLQSLLLNLFSSLHSLYPHVALKQAQYYVKHLGPFLGPDSHPKIVRIVEIDESGNIIGNLQNTNEKMYLISQISIGEKYTYFGSPWVNQLWRIKTELLNY